MPNDAETREINPDLVRAAPAALARLSQSLHSLIEQSVRMVDEDSAFEDDIVWAAEQLAHVRERLSRHARRAELNIGRPGDPPDGRPYYVAGVLVGDHHAMNMPVDLTTENGLTKGRVNLDVAWEGPPGCVHGGYVAHLFDCILGQHSLNLGVPGMTGTLTVRYRRPTPLHTDLTFEVRTDEPQGRKITARSELRAGGEVCAEAEGIFIVPQSSTVGLPVWSDD